MGHRNVMFADISSICMIVYLTDAKCNFVFAINHLFTVDTSNSFVIKNESIF
jgi:hypothetical protein